MFSRYRAEPDIGTSERVEVVFPAVALDRSLAMGAAWGVAAWAAYAVVEYTLCTIWPLFTVDVAVFTPVNWSVNAWIFNAYWVFGAVAGAICGAIVGRLPARAPKAPEDRLRLAGAFSLYLAMLLNLLLRADFQFGTRTVLAMDLVMLGATAWVILRPESRLAPWVKIPPLLAAFLLVGPAWLGGDVLAFTETLERRTLMILLVLAIVAAGWLLRRLREGGPSRHLAATLACLALAVFSSGILSGRNGELPPLPGNPGTDPGLSPVVLFTFDTTRADHMSVYGYSRKTTPNLEQFARGATVYTDAVAASDWTLPAHASIFTGVYASWHGARSYVAQPAVIRPLEEGYPTLAEILKNRGAVTVGVAANKAVLRPEWGLTKGFRTFDVQMPVEILPLLHTYYLRYGVRRVLSCCMETMAFDAQYRTAAEIDAEAIGLLEEPLVRNRSFFLFLNYMDAHGPYVAPVPAGVPLPAGQGAPRFSQLSAIFEDVLSGRGTFPEPARTLAMERYDAGIATEDAGFEEIVQWLRRRGLYDRAMIIVTADHGEAFGEHNLAAHGVSTYQDQVHVPLIIKYPNQSSAEVVRTPVSHVDILSTVLDTLGIPAPDHVQGRSLRHAEALQVRPVYVESFPSTHFTRLTPRLDRTERAIRLGNYKLIVSDKGKHEIFDLARDPQELHNLTALGVPEAAGMETTLREWIGHLPAPKAQAPTSQDQMKMLKGLGYVR